MFDEEEVIGYAGVSEDSVTDNAEVLGLGEELHGIIETAELPHEVAGGITGQGIVQCFSLFYGNYNTLISIFPQLIADCLLIEEHTVLRIEFIDDLPERTELIVAENIDNEEMQAYVIIGEALAAVGVIQGIFRDMAAVHGN